MLGGLLSGQAKKFTTTNLFLERSSHQKKKIARLKRQEYVLKLPLSSCPVSKEIIVK